jgi:hypothetical protein
MSADVPGRSRGCFPEVLLEIEEELGAGLGRSDPRHDDSRFFAPDGVNFTAPLTP